MSDETSGTWHQLVPELFYDLIARVPAGVVFWLLIGIWTAPALRRYLVEVSPEHFPFGVAFVILLLLAYIVGIIIVPISNVVQGAYKPWPWKRLCADNGEYITRLVNRFLVETRSADAPPSSMSRSEVHAFQNFLHEALKHESAHARVILQKMSAEVRLCDNLFTVCVAVAIAHVISVRDVPQPPWVWCALAAGVLAVMAAPYRYLRLLQRRISYARALGYCAETNNEERRSDSGSPKSAA